MCSHSVVVATVGWHQPATQCLLSRKAISVQQRVKTSDSDCVALRYAARRAIRYTLYAIHYPLQLLQVHTRVKLRGDPACGSHVTLQIAVRVACSHQSAATVTLAVEQRVKDGDIARYTRLVDAMAVYRRLCPVQAL